MAQKKKLSLKVIFDTNVIYTGSASDLLRNEIVDLINSHKSLADIEIEWYIPDTVIKERLFQMNKKGNDLLPSLQKLEKIIGHNLNITSDIIGDRINDTVNKQIQSFGINTIKIDTKQVDWEVIINNSLNRLPPFEDNEKEKGFRDALILESLKQIISKSPVTKSICRIIFITGDGQLNKAARLINNLPNNVDILANVEELVSLINILDSEITEDRINKIIIEAQKMFFVEKDETTLYYTQQIRQKISHQFSDELSIKEHGADIRENGTWWIGSTGFEKKQKQQIIWKNIITVDFSNYKTIMTSNNPLRNYTGEVETFNPLRTYSIDYAKYSQLNRSTNLLQPSTEYYGRQTIPLPKEKINDGKTKFEVTWSVTLTTNNKLKNPKIDSINYLETIFS